MKVEYTTKVRRNDDGTLYAQPPHGDAHLLRDVVLQEAERKHGGHVTVKISTPHRPRSTGKGSQSAHFHGHVQSIAMETGQPAEDVKSYLKAKAVDLGYPMLMDTEGNPILNLWGTYQGISEADASVEDEIKLIEAAHMLAADLGIRLIEEAA